ncbi:dual specificity protein phosphatase MPK-4 [Drosophila sulfurigaster albostrigata]|uniref:dual specificity protein phosphatase MPK-4 n=1 Tax=Drosophila sulfurigaster albostrigata TaxID=89887 RepID=UPI002D21D879|nr:dual specificity protein phosphatase MPK-4 [Drosophila sulfurigaster albostrigata]XP_062140740.1 dual specificity protein phosphatase MPK-4 [Drosophila sulfurigaster albostrigata]
MAAAATATKCGKPQDAGNLTRDDFDGGPVSIDEVETGLFLGNLTAATHMETLKSFKITHILTLDSVPLPQHIVDTSFLTTKYVQIADMPREDILQHLEACVEFIANALEQQQNVLVHCYFGVSRSSSAVIAYVMKAHQLDYQAAYEMVRAKRRFVQPNAGFVAQLKLFRRMGYKIDPGYQRYKMHRLRLAGEQMRKAKILPQSFHNVVRPDPDITRENPEPIVFRCRRCRRVLATKSHVLEHRARNAPPQSQPQSQPPPPSTDAPATAEGAEPPRLLEQLAERIRKTSLGSPSHEQTSQCRSLLFVEPIAWMHRIMLNTQGRLYCPKCEQKLGNFSWVNACQCPCGETMTPAFYLIPSKVELSKAVQNVQTTV